MAPPKAAQAIRAVGGPKSALWRLDAEAELIELLACNPSLVRCVALVALLPVFCLLCCLLCLVDCSDALVALLAWWPCYHCSRVAVVLCSVA